VTHSTEKVL